MVSPGGFDPGALEFMASLVQVLHGDQGQRAEIDLTSLVVWLRQLFSLSLPYLLSPGKIVELAVGSLFNAVCQGISTVTR